MQNRWLFLPAFEVLFVWCGFRSLRKKAKASLMIVEEAVRKNKRELKKKNEKEKERTEERNE